MEAARQHRLPDGRGGGGGVPDEAEQFESPRSETERHAQIINEVRGRFDQEPMLFDRVVVFNEVLPVDMFDVTTKEMSSKSFRVAVVWSQTKANRLLRDALYDLVEELGRAAMADTSKSDFEQAEALHATRSEKA